MNTNTDDKIKDIVREVLSEELEKVKQYIKEESNKVSQTGVRISWSVNTSDSGIQIVGSTVVTKVGEIISVFPITLPNGKSDLVFFVKGDDNSHNIVSVDQATYI